MATYKSEQVDQSLTDSRDLKVARNDNETNGSCSDLAIQDEVYFPDGGINAWRTALGGFLAFIPSIGFMSGGSIFQSYYVTTTLSSTNPSDIAWIGSVQLWGCFAFGIYAGRLSDRYGPSVPLGVGTIFLVLGTMMASISTQYYQFLLSQGFCEALGMGLIFTPALAIQSQWFLKRRGLVVGAVMSGQNVGGMYLVVLYRCRTSVPMANLHLSKSGIIWPVLTDALLTHDGMSLGWTLRIIGFMQLGLMIAATILVRPRFPRTSKFDALPVRKYFTDRRTMMFTTGMMIMNLGIYIPWVSGIYT